MRRLLAPHQGSVLGAAAAALVLGWLNIGVSTPSAADAAGVAAFLRPGYCYRFTFSIEGAPAWKVLEVLDGGWIKAEVDAGPASAQRAPAWINTAQLVTVRETRCSD